MNGCAGAMGAGRPLRRLSMRPALSTRPARLRRGWPWPLAFVVSLIFAVAWSEEAHAVSNTEHLRFAPVSASKSGR